MIRLQSYIQDRWVPGTGPARTLYNPATEEPVAETATGGIDFARALEHGRSAGGPALRASTFAERGGLLKQMARVLHEHRDELLDLSRDNNGATRGDARFDIDGATGTLAAYATLGKALGDRTILLDGEAERLGPGARFVGQHVRVPLRGVAVHVNAFNFPAWGTFEKVAVALLASVPVMSKPAAATALTAWRMVELVVEAGILPPGALSFVAGPPGDLLSHLEPQDALAFTGSADTAAALRAAPGITERSARVNIEADSLNAAVLGPGVETGSESWHLFVRNVVRDMTQKTGQKCTAIRRVLVPADRADEVQEALVAELDRVVVGNPADTAVTMGPVATAAQLRDVRLGIGMLAEQTVLLRGGVEAISGRGSPEGKGWFVAPTLLRAKDARAAPRAHSHEVFGPCATLLPYDGSAEEAAGLVALGQGCLVTSVYADDRAWLGAFLGEAMAWNGRIVVASEKVADQVLPPGMVMPNQVHGGPGRAGGGEELGGLRGLDFYSRRVAIQGDSGVLRKLFGEYRRFGWIGGAAVTPGR